MNLTRHAKIIEIMERQNTISIRELAEKLSCTEMTVRRNLDQLEEQNLVRRERGYAYLLKNARRTDYYEEINENAAEKKEIAGEALKFLRPNMSICLDSGSLYEVFIERNCEYLVVEQQERKYNNYREYDTHDNVRLFQGEYGSRAEQCAANVGGDIGRGGEQVHEHITYCQSAHGYHRNRRIALYLGILTSSQEEYCRADRHRHDYVHFLGDACHCCNSHCAEGNVRKTVTDEREPLQNKRNAQQR